VFEVVVSCVFIFEVTQDTSHVVYRYALFRPHFDFRGLCKALNAGRALYISLFYIIGKLSGV
jgi:hypothetical protein